MKRLSSPLSALVACCALAVFPFTATAGEHEQTAHAAMSLPELKQALASLPAGDPTRGATVHRELFCASCHGERGEALTQNWPALAGQRAAYTAKMLLDYQQGRRQANEGSKLMQAIAEMMTPHQIADVAAFYAAQSPAPVPSATNIAVTAEQRQAAERLVRHGDPSRLITPCASCHGVRGQGGLKKQEVPALAGQNPPYFLRMLWEYHLAKRSNDVEKSMRVFAQPLTPEEMQALAVYYANLPSKGR